MKKKSDELKEKRGQLLDEVDGILKSDNSDFKRVEEIRKEIDDLNTKISLVEQVEKDLEDRASVEENVGRVVYGLPKNKDGKRSKKSLANSFMLGRALKQIKDRGVLAGAEKEAYEEADNESGISSSFNIAIPSFMIKIGDKSKSNPKWIGNHKYCGVNPSVMRDITIATEGADLEFDEFVDFIPALTAMPVVVDAGATVIQDAVGDQVWPRESGVATFTWEGETDAGAETTPTYDNVTASPKRVGGFIEISKQAIKQSVFNLTQQVTGSLNRGFSVELDNKAIGGSGTSDQPTGIINVSGIGDFSIGANGGALTWTAVTSTEKEALIDNSMGPHVYLTNPKVTNAGKTIAKASGGAIAEPILRDGPPSELNMNGYPLFITNNVPSNLTDGTASNLSALIFGQMSSLYIVQWGGFEILYDPFTAAKSYMDTLVFNALLDIQVRHAEDFSACQDIVAS